MNHSDLTFFGIAKFTQSYNFASEINTSQTHAYARIRLPDNVVDNLGCDVDAVLDNHEIDKAREQNGIEAVQLNLEPQVC